MNIGVESVGYLYILDSSERRCEFRSLNWTGIPRRLVIYAKTSYNPHGLKICLCSLLFSPTWRIFV
jgi:hypothetical protein